MNKDSLFHVRSARFLILTRADFTLPHLSYIYLHDSHLKNFTSNKLIFISTVIITYLFFTIVKTKMYGYVFTVFPFLHQQSNVESLSFCHVFYLELGSLSCCGRAIH